MAAAFGTSPEVAAFWMAFRFAHLLRRVFGEGALHAAFIPHFEAVRKKSPQEGARFFWDLSQVVAYSLIGIVLVAEGILGSFLLRGHLSEGNREIVQLTMTLLPALLFISLYALNASLLNCERSFFLPSVAPSSLNLVWIGAVLYLWHSPRGSAMLTLAMLLVFAFALQWAITLPKVFGYLKAELKGDLSRKGFSYREIGRIIRPFALGIIGVTATQINTALDALFARVADPEGPAYLWYALRLQQLPLALFGIGLAGAILPPMTRAIQEGNKERARHFLNYGFKRSLLLMVPCTAAIYALGYAGVDVVYGHGAFSALAAQQTTLALWMYGSALLPMTLVLLFGALFYANRDYRTPLMSALLCVGINLMLNAFFVYGLKWGAVSIACATFLASLVNALFLFYVLKKRELIDTAGIWSVAWRLALIGFGGMTMVAVTLSALKGEWVPFMSFPPLEYRSLTLQLTTLGIQSMSFILGSAPIALLLFKTRVLQKTSRIAEK